MREFSSKNVFYFLLILILSSQSFYSQIKIEGTVQDTSRNNLSGATVILQSLLKDSENQFTNTDENGKFSFNIPHKNFKLKVSYISFTSYSELIHESILENIIIKLSPQVDNLDEIILNYKPPPIQIKVDTLTFLAKEFSDGQEYKLKNLIQKLPGVDYEGGILSINGKRISKVLIEGDRFFNGSTLLAIENVPANAIEKLEFIDDYSNSKLLKNFKNSDETVLNLKLKENKKNFYFGDIDLYYGNGKFYKSNPSLFKYSKNHKYAIIGSANNIGSSLENILALQETISNENAYSSGILEELKFENKEVKNISEKAIGAAYDGHIRDTKKISINIVGHEADRNYLIRSYNKYFSDPIISEDRDLKRNQKLKNYFAGLGYENELKNQGELKIITEINKEVSSDSKYLTSNYNLENINIEVKDQKESSGLKNEFHFLKKITSRFTLNSKLFFILRSENQHLQIEGNDDFLEQFIIKDEELGIFSQASTEKLGELYFSNDLFYSFNIKNSLKLSGTINPLIYKKTLDNRLEDSNSDPATFSDSFDVFSDVIFESIYTYKDAKFFVELGMSFLNRKLPSKTENFFLPKVSLEYKPSFGNEIQVKYSISSKRPVLDNHFQGNLLKDFNYIEIGNTQLSSEKYQNFSFSSLFTNLRKGLTFRGDFNYQISDNSVIRNNFTSSVNLITKFSNLNTPTNDFNTRLVIGKIISIFKLNGTIGYRKYERGRGLNGNLTFQKIGMQRAKVHLETLFENETPNLLFKYTLSNTHFNTGEFDSKFSSNTYNFGVKNNSGKFTYLLEYEYSHNVNHFGDSFSNLKFNLDYNFENSPFLITLFGENLLNSNYLNSQSIQDRFISEVQIARLPAMVLLGLTYKI